MKSNKGGMTGEILMAVAAIMVAITMFLIIETEGAGVQEQKISETVDIQISEVRDNTVISNMLNDKLHRISEVDKGEYGNISAYKVISYYFSTPGSKVQVKKDGSEKDRNTVRNHLKKYIGHKLNKTYRTGAEKSDYFIDIQNYDDPPSRPTKLRLKTYDPSNTPAVIATIGLTKGDKVQLTFYKDGESPIFQP